MSTKVKLQLAYDGSEFGGWQRQKTAMPTVQGVLEKAVSRLFNTNVKVVGAGRTDAGVHALGQVAHFVAPQPIERYNLVHAINSLTPASLSVHQAWEVPDEFHALASCTGKVYRYLILNTPTPSALRRHHFTWMRHPLDLENLNQMSQFLVGEQDFKSFQSAGTPVKSTVRKVWKAHWRRRSPQLVEFSIHGNGFLKQMVRNIVGTLLELQWNKEPPETIREILNARDRSQAGTTAPPQGLYLYHVQYPSSLDNKCRKL